MPISTALTARAVVRSADETLKVNNAAIETAKVELSYCFIHAPIDGRAGQRLVDIGNVVNPGGQANAQDNGNVLLVIERLNPIYADFTISQTHLSAVQQEMQQGSLRTEVRLPDTSEAVTGQLTFVDNAIQNETGQVTLRATSRLEHYRRRRSGPSLRAANVSQRIVCLCRQR